MELITSKFSGIVKYKCLCVSRVGNWNARWISLSRFISLSLTPCLPFCPRVTPCPYLSLLRFTISLFSYYLLSFSIPSLLYLTLPPLSVSRFLLSLSLSLSLHIFSLFIPLYLPTFTPFLTLHTSHYIYIILPLPLPLALFCLSPYLSHSPYIYLSVLYLSPCLPILSPSLSFLPVFSLNIFYTFKGIKWYPINLFQLSCLKTL